MTTIANFSIGMRVEVKGGRSKTPAYTNRHDAYNNVHEELPIFAGDRGTVTNFIKEEGIVVALDKADHIATWFSPNQICPTSGPLENMPKTRIKPIFEYMDLLNETGRP